MKDIKPIHLMIAVVLFLIALAFSQWAQFFRTTPAPSPATSPASIDQPEELPVLPQNKLEGSEAVLPVENDLDLPEENPVKDNDVSQDPALNEKKPEF